MFGDEISEYCFDLKLATPFVQISGMRLLRSECLSKGVLSIGQFSSIWSVLMDGTVRIEVCFETIKMFTSLIDVDHIQVILTTLPALSEKICVAFGTILMSWSADSLIRSLQTIHKRMESEDTVKVSALSIEKRENISNNLKFLLTCNMEITGSVRDAIQDLIFFP